MFFRRIIVRRRVIHPDKAKIAFRDGQSVSLMGIPFTISVEEDEAAKYSTARVKGGTVRIKLPMGLRQSQKEKHITNLARRAMTRAILPHVKGKVDQFNSLHFQSELGAVRLKDNVSNWGSCSRKNNINLDFRLLFGPQDILDAVILHELTHTKHRNHSGEFYGTLLAINPDNKQKLRWLRDNGAKLNAESSVPPATEQPMPQQLSSAKPDLPIWQLP